MKKALFVVLLFLISSFKHPFYLSVTELKYNASQKELQGSVKLFINDFEDALKRLHGKTVDLINPKDTIQLNKVLKDYLQKHLLIKINDQTTAYELLGFEKEQEAIWMYIEVKNCPEPKKLELENTLLYDFIKEQTNIVHFESVNINKSSKVSWPEKKILFDLKN